MEYAICDLSIIPVRREAAEQSEMITQLLFGELYMITRKEGKWHHIVALHDRYEGWISANQSRPISKRQFDLDSKARIHYSFELASTVSNSTAQLALTLGAGLRNFDGLSFTLAGESFIHQAAAVEPASNGSLDTLEKIARKYLHAPYLWGGRTPFGIDCSGFSQIVYRFMGHALPRDAYQQAAHGRDVSWVSESECGDLAFFENEQRKITHVGIVLKKSEIIHASGKVRIDQLDQNGIFNRDKNSYSHKLHSIKRIL